MRAFPFSYKHLSASGDQGYTIPGGTFLMCCSSHTAFVILLQISFASENQQKRKQETWSKRLKPKNKLKRIPLLHHTVIIPAQ